MMIYGIYTGDSRLIGEVSLFACVETGYWLFTALEKNRKRRCLDSSASHERVLKIQ